MVDYKKICAAAMCLALCFSAAAPVGTAVAEEESSAAAETADGVISSGNCSYYPLGDGKAVLVSITAYANLGVRVSLEGLDDLIDLELLAVADIPLVDDEEYVTLE